MLPTDCVVLIALLIPWVNGACVNLTGCDYESSRLSCVHLARPSQLSLSNSVCAQVNGGTNDWMPRTKVTQNSKGHTVYFNSIYNFLSLMRRCTDYNATSGKSFKVLNAWMITGARVINQTDRTVYTISLDLAQRDTKASSRTLQYVRMNGDRVTPASKWTIVQTEEQLYGLMAALERQSGPMVWMGDFSMNDTDLVMNFVPAVWHLFTGAVDNAADGSEVYVVCRTPHVEAFCKQFDHSRNYCTQCKGDYMGRYCTMPDFCRHWPCNNNGTLRRYGERCLCTCVDGYQGYFCEAETNECDQTPCKHNGRCVDKFLGYDCICNEGYYGKDCENQSPENKPYTAIAFACLLPFLVIFLFCLYVSKRYETKDAGHFRFMKDHRDAHKPEPKQQPPLSNSSDDLQL